MIPAFNESATIAAVVRGALEHAMVIVVDDGSSDETRHLAEKAGARVVSHCAPQGYDAALDRGFREAATLDIDHVLTMDADGQHSAGAVAAFVAAAAAGADVVAGVRDHKQRVAEHLFALVTRVVLGIRDPLCGMKMYRLSVYRALGHFDSYRSIGTELLLYAACTSRLIAQVPIVTPRRQGAPRFGSGLRPNLRIVMALLRFLRRAMFGFDVQGPGQSAT
ncbi:MAG: glycosyltransferase family 2 protein [Pseudomonadota bacterium]